MSLDYLERQIRLLRVSAEMAATPGRAEAYRERAMLYERSLRSNGKRALEKAGR